MNISSLAKEFFVYSVQGWLEKERQPGWLWENVYIFAKLLFCCCSQLKCWFKLIFKRFENCIMGALLQLCNISFLIRKTNNIFPSLFNTELFCDWLISFLILVSNDNDNCLLHQPTLTMCPFRHTNPRIWNCRFYL